MATSDSIQLAQSVVDKINTSKRALVSVAESVRDSLSEADSIIVNPVKKAILLDGAAGLSINVNELKTEKEDLQKVVQHILNNVSALTK